MRSPPWVSHRSTAQRGAKATRLDPHDTASARVLATRLAASLFYGVSASDPATFAATAVSCDAEILYRCSNGQPRILRPVGSTMTATQTGGAATGVVTTTYNVFSFDLLTKQEVPVAGLTVQNQFIAFRR